MNDTYTKTYIHIIDNKIHFKSLRLYHHRIHNRKLYFTNNNTYLQQSFEQYKLMIITNHLIDNNSKLLSVQINFKQRNVCKEGQL